MKVLIIGARGMAGHVITLYLKEQGYDIITTSSRNPEAENYYDAEKNIYGIEKIIEREKPDAVINCAGILNKDAEENHTKAVMINSLLPNFLNDLSKKYDFKLIHISTDCVFEGDKGDYDESANPDATSFYGKSKALGEIKDDDKTVTLRFSIVGPDTNENGIGLFQWFSNQTGTVKGFSKVNWTGITTIELARIIDFCLKNNISGFHHAVSGEKISKADLLRLFEKYFNFGITVEDDPSYVSNKTLVRTDKSYDFKIPSYDVMVKNMYDWVKNHEDIYTNLIGRMN